MPVQFSLLIPKNADIHTCYLLFDHFQFALIHGPNSQGSYRILLLQHWTLLLSPAPSTTGCYFCFGSISSFFLELFLQWSPVTYWAPTDLGVHLPVSCLFAFSCCSWGSQGKNTEVVCNSLLQWTTFCQTSPPWPMQKSKRVPEKHLFLLYWLCQSLDCVDHNKLWK